MNTVLGIISIILGLLILASVGILLLARAARSTRPLPKPCYRCAEIAVVEYMGLHYCIMCRTAVVSAYPMVRHDPPYGFPGAPGYLEFPDHEFGYEKKKEN